MEGTRFCLKTPYERKAHNSKTARAVILGCDTLLNRILSINLPNIIRIFLSTWEWESWRE